MGKWIELTMGPAKLQPLYTVQGLALFTLMAMLNRTFLRSNPIVLLPKLVVFSLITLSCDPVLHSDLFLGLKFAHRPPSSPPPWLLASVVFIVLIVL